MTTKPLTHASLFSGIGGAELAAHWAGFTNVFHCEINPFCQQVLNHWWPNSQSYDDITTIDFSPWRGRVSVLSGGFPCQPFSLAGKRRGTNDNRYLWPQMLRAIDQIRPTWVIGENVVGLLSMVEQPKCKVSLESKDNSTTTSRGCCGGGGGQPVVWRIVSDLEAVGYDCQVVNIPAAATNAPHLRARLWFLAHCKIPHYANSNGNRLQTRPQTNQSSQLLEPYEFFKCTVPPRPQFAQAPIQPPFLGGDDGIPTGLYDPPFYGGARGRKNQCGSETIKAMGNAWVPQVAYEIFNAIRIIEESN